MREQLKAYFRTGRGVFHRQFAELIAELDGRGAAAAEQMRLAAALVSRQLELGEIALRLDVVAGARVLEDLADPEDAPEPILAPALADWLAALQESPVVSVGGGVERPLVLDGNRLYLYRYFDYQRRLRAALSARARDSGLAPAAVRAELDRVFPSPAAEIDWQRLAAALALHRQLAVITGGAGTGKTTTVVKILAALQRLHGGLRIALAAPTGKAAARLSEAIRGAKAGLSLPAEELDGIPEAASTIHRLLGVRRNSPFFRHGADNPLPVDCLVLDEASMVDLALMCKLVEALPPHCRLIMLGDPHQLAAVEAGSVLAELAEPGLDRFSADCAAWLSQATGFAVAASDAGAGGLAVDTAIGLKRTHRNQGGILALANAIRSGDAAAAAALLDDPATEDATWHRPQEGGWLTPALFDEIKAWFLGYRGVAPAEALKQVDAFRVLCAHRDGPLGVDKVNARIEQALRRAGAIAGGDWYPGRPVMVTRNDYALGLYNGDVGVCLPDATGAMRVWFPGSLEPRAFAPGRLPEHETVFAMTVHKTQGSEFGQILLLLPEQKSAIVDRALLYTAVTRAKRGVRVFDPGSVLSHPVLQDGRANQDRSSKEHHDERPLRP